MCGSFNHFQLKCGYFFQRLVFRFLQILAITIPCLTDSGFYTIPGFTDPGFTIPCFKDSGSYNSMFYRFRLLLFCVLKIPVFTDSVFYDSLFYRFRFLQFCVFQIWVFTILCFTDSSFYNSGFSHSSFHSLIPHSWFYR